MPPGMMDMLNNMTPEQEAQLQQMMGGMGAGGMGGLGGLGGMFGGMGGAGAGGAAADTRPPREKYASELAQVKEMGFNDEETIL